MSASIVVFGPQGCGKSLHAEQLRQHFKCRTIIDDDFSPGVRRIYAALISGDQEALAREKSKGVLYLTNEPPPPGVDLSHTRRVIPYACAAKMAGISSGGAA